MGHQHMYDLCCQYHGKRVRITDHSGHVHVGTITRVSRRRVWIMPDGGVGGGGYGFGWAYGPYGYGYPGVGYGIALGAIAGIALTTAFLW